MHEFIKWRTAPIFHLETETELLTRLIFDGIMKTSTKDHKHSYDQNGVIIEVTQRTDPDNIIIHTATITSARWRWKGFRLELGDDWSVGNFCFDGHVDQFEVWLATQASEDK